MITKTMSLREVLLEMSRDYIETVERVSLRKGKKFRRIVLKARKFPVIASDIYVSPRKNTWIMIFTAYNKKHIGGQELVRQGVVADRENGLHLYLLERDDSFFYLLVFNPHFFNRYKERTGSNERGVELMREFLLTSGHVVFEVSGDKCILLCDNGVFLGTVEVINRITLALHLKTYIREDMTYRNQITRLKKYSESIKDENDWIL